MKNNPWFKLASVSLDGVVLSLGILMAIQSFNENNYNMNQGRNYNVEIQGATNIYGSIGLMDDVDMMMQGNM